MIPSENLFWFDFLTPPCHDVPFFGTASHWQEFAIREKKLFCLSVRLSQKQLLEPLGFSVKHQFTHAAGHWGSKKWPTGPRVSVIENTISDWLLTGHCRCEVFHQSLTDSHLLSAMSVKALLGVRLGKWCYAVYMYIRSFSESNWYILS